MKMKKLFSVLLLPFLLIALVVGFCYCALFVEFKWSKNYIGQEAVKPYTNGKCINEMMPSIPEVGTPEKIEYKKYRAAQYIFSWDADYLFCQYTPEEYVQQKQQLEENYAFREDSITIQDYTFEPSAEIDGYHFRLLSDEGEYEPYITYPKFMVLVGYSDEEQQIIYLSTYDFDLDYITSLPEFIRQECGWNYIHR